MTGRPELLFPLRRILIMGNGGSGKTWLARRLAARLGLEAVHFDDIYWQPGRYGIARDKPVVIGEVERLAEADAWLMEGVYGWLINAILSRASLLLWLDLSEEECVANVRSRGIQGGESRESFDGLVRWVSGYRARKDNWSSFDAHRKLFDDHDGAKFRFESREEIVAYLTQIPERSR
ncbi:AAA family ATPase [Rhizobium puerariae]|uniref:AAA family ATPase n=1 Tax=Rhizobium puerariae TaxID=1585791 RepID=A0ABV6AQA1_9HYPH